MLSPEGSLPSLYFLFFSLWGTCILVLFFPHGFIDVVMSINHCADVRLPLRDLLGQSEGSLSFLECH
jgi:hypothetical protein